MKIYNAEIESGLKDKILSTASIAYSVQIEPNTDEKLLTYIHTIAKDKDGKFLSKDGLYLTKSILVSTVWNLNDDVFDKEEVWEARSTPEDKPTNLGHDEKQIVGHITGNYPINDSGEIIPEDTPIDDLPNKYHIINSAVIYTLWQDKELQDRTKALIEEIESGKKFVSMECVFRGFDYAVLAPDGTSHVIARNNESAFLTKHLRAYGGDGIYENHRIGRLLRNITFSGKGYVDKPANPESIILKGQDFLHSSVSQNNVFFNKSGVLIFRTESKIMENPMEKELAELKQKLAELEVKSAADIKNANDKVAELTKNIEDSKAEIKKLNETLVAEKAKSDELVKTLDETKKSLEKSNSELSAVKASELKTKRIAKLVAGKVAQNVAESKVDQFANLNDAQFDIVAEALIAAVAPKVDEDIDTDPKDVDTPTDAGQVVDKTKASDTQVNTNTDTDTKNSETTRASIANWLKASFGQKE